LAYQQDSRAAASRISLFHQLLVFSVQVQQNEKDLRYFGKIENRKPVLSGAEGSKIRNPAAPAAGWFEASKDFMYLLEAPPSWLARELMQIRACEQKINKTITID